MSRFSNDGEKALFEYAMFEEKLYSFWRFDSEDYDDLGTNERCRLRWQILDSQFPDIAAKYPVPTLQEAVDLCCSADPLWVVRDEMYGLDASLNDFENSIYGLLHRTRRALRKKALDYYTGEVE